MTPPFLKKPQPEAPAEAVEKKKGNLMLPMVILALIGGSILFWVKRHDWGISSIFASEPAEKHIPDPVQYAHLKEQLAIERDVLAARYRRARSEQEKDEILDEASALLEHSMPQLMRCWLGHPWDFHGTATIPGKGKIACGYYVSVIMRDTGFKVERMKLAQQPSQKIISTFTRKRWISGGGMNYNSYVNKITPKYEGINIVGLDRHVAFIVIKDGKMRFIHSTRAGQKCVVDESKSQAGALKYSKYRVIGNISRNKDILRKWILGEPFPTAR